MKETKIIEIFKFGNEVSVTLEFEGVTYKGCLSELIK